MFNRLKYYIGVLSQDMELMAKAHWQQYNTLLLVLEPLCGKLQNKIILDIGCGKFHPNTTLLQNAGNNVIGIDKSSGVLEIAKIMLYRLLGKERQYFRKMAAYSGLDHNDTHIVQMDAEKLEFADNTFDIVISNATFEHIKNVTQAVSELARVLKVDGIAYISIHLFTSFSGGHQFNYEKVPWGHLRGYGSAPVYLNRLRETEYLNIFARHLNVIKDIAIGYGEGEKMLTPEIMSELKGYSKAELLKKDIIIVARK